MADQGRSDFHVVRTWIKTIVNKFAISNHMALILDVYALRSYLKLICEYELHSLPSKKVSGTNDDGKNCNKVRQSLVRCLLHNRQLNVSTLCPQGCQCNSEFAEK